MGPFIADAAKKVQQRQEQLLCGATISRPSKPRILPTRLYTVVVATEANICAIAVADL
jgi:hypothetical protein